MAGSEEDAEAETVAFSEIGLYDLLRAMHGVLDRYEREHPPGMHLHGEVFSVRDQLHRLLKRLEGGRPFDALDDLRSRSCRAEAVAAFLALLEMARLGLIRLHQTAPRRSAAGPADSFGAVLIYRTAKEVDIEAIEGIHG